MTIKKILPSILLFLVLLAVYLGTMAPGLTWANDGADGGDLITAAATGGVPHPTGYPTYILIAAQFQNLPFGSLAYRTNLLSALAAALASVLVYGIVCFLPASPVKGNQPAGLLAGILFGLSPLLWSQAVITEVYTLQALLAALAVFLALWRPPGHGDRAVDVVTGLVLGLAVGNHLTSVFLIPPAVLMRMMKSPKRLDLGSLARIVAGLAAGSLIYLALPLRALSKPPVNWGNPVTMDQFIWLVTGKLYQRRLGVIPFTGFLDRLSDLAVILLRQFELPGIVLLLMGVIYFFKPVKIYAFTLWNAVVFTLFALLYATYDSYLYLIPVVLSCAIWIGNGLGGLIEPSQHYRRGLIGVVKVLLCIFVIALLIQRWPKMDLSHDRQAEEFGQRLVETVPNHALIFAEDDKAIFTLWYEQHALGQRPDLTVIATDLLHFSWYDATLRSTYPGIAWPQGYLWPQTIMAENPSLPVCVIAGDAEDQTQCSTPP